MTSKMVSCGVQKKTIMKPQKEQESRTPRTPGTMRYACTCHGPVQTHLNKGFQHDKSLVETMPKTPTRFMNSRASCLAGTLLVALGSPLETPCAYPLKRRMLEVK